MQTRTGKVASFEANGGGMLGSSIAHEGRHLAALPTCDTQLPALAALILTRKEGLAATLATLPRPFTHSYRLKSNPTAFVYKTISEPAWLLQILGLATDIQVDIDLTKSIRIQLADSNTVHFRASINAPELRYCAEANTQYQAIILVNRV